MQPTMVVLDLDPGPPATIVECCRVATWLRTWFLEHDMQAFPKTSGSKGLQVYAPINRPTDYDKTKHISRALAQKLERVARHGDLFEPVQTLKQKLPASV